MVSRKVIVIIITGAIAVLIALSAWLISSGYLRIVFLTPPEDIVVTANVCESNTVDRYNEATLYKMREENAALPTMDTEEIAAIAVDIRDRPNYEADATCQAMLFWAAATDGNYENAKRAYDSLKDLHQASIFPDNNIRISVPLFEYESALEYISSAQEEAN